MVTHDPRFAAHADRQVHLFDGKVIAEGELQQLLAEPQYAPHPQAVRTAQA
jgi:putative ABC transport system ATP-binding protein